MSKKTLLLCLVAIACFVSAEAFLGERIEHAKKVLGDIISDAIADFQHAVFKIKERAMEDMDDLRQRALEITQGVYKTVGDAVNSIDQKIADLTGEADGVDISECTAMANEIHNTGLAIIANSSACVTEKIERGSGYIESINVIADEVLNNLTDIGHEAIDCTREIGGIEGTVRALACLASCTKDALLTSTRKIPAVLLQLTKLSALVGTIIPSLQYCTVTRSVSTFIEQAHEISITMEACVEEKVHVFEISGSSTTNEIIPTRPTPTGTIPVSTTERVHRPLASFEDDLSEEVKPLAIKL